MPNEEEILQLCGQIWDATLRLPLERQDAGSTLPQAMLSACVHISGAWTGTVALSCDAELTALTAQIMFDLSRPDTTEADMRDALGELVNMIGGNVKALLPEPCKLSVPEPFEAATVKATPVTQVQMRCGDRPLYVSVLEQREEAA